MLNGLEELFDAAASGKTVGENVASMIQSLTKGATDVIGAARGVPPAPKPVNNLNPDGTPKKPIWPYVVGGLAVAGLVYVVYKKRKGKKK